MTLATEYDGESSRYLNKHNRRDTSIYIFSLISERIYFWK